MKNNSLGLLKLKIQEWLAEVNKSDPHLLQLKKELEKLAFLLCFAGFIPALVFSLVLGKSFGEFIGELFGAVAIGICIFVTYLNWKYR
ncbi:MAG: hypothetical protein ACOX2P_04560 [Bacillota bacterium]|jgi:hypothetical protein